MKKQGLCNVDNILTIDLEEWYHPEYVRKLAPANGRERASESISQTLHLLNECNSTATFFVVGEIAERHPELIEKILENGHEVAFHGYSHKPLWEIDADRLRLEIEKFTSLIGRRCIGFRAPSFSLNNETRWALKVLEDMDFSYDSSVFPSKTPLYGVPQAPIKPYKPSDKDITVEDKNGKLWEFPVLVYPLVGANLPMGGGFFLRLFPTYILAETIKRMSRLGFPAVIYVHSWELDDRTPKLKLGPYASFVTYYNIQDTRKKLKRLLSSFHFKSVRNYMSEQAF